MTVLPGALRRKVEGALEELGHAAQILDARPLSGGCINPSARLDVEGGECFFLKWNERAPPGMFPAEAEGLGALRETAAGSGLRVPEVLAVGAGDAGTAWLLLEYVPEGRGGGGYAGALGAGLAALHRGVGGDRASYGWERDNFIGSLAQENGASSRWADFWRERRLGPQLSLARSRGHFHGADGRLLDKLVDRLDDALAGAEEDGASLLHGDLWGGNVYPGPAGEPVLIDPAVYRGHREVDLAMSELFGGFPSGYLERYHEAWPIDDAYARIRRPLYQLYYLLVHVNLFGGSYVAGSLAAVERVLAEV